MSYKVLLVDDSITQLGVLKMQLINSGFEVVTANDGYEGYKKVFETAPDLILSDIVMPKLNGYQFSRLLKNANNTKNIPVILLTVLDKKIDKFWGNKSGANEFISKTANFTQIEESIKKNIEQNKVSEESKQNILNDNVTNEFIQNKISDTFDDLLMQSTFLSDFRDLEEFLLKESLLVEKTFKLLSSFIDYDLAGLFINNPDSKSKKTLIFDVSNASVSSFVLEKIKRDFFAQMPESSERSIRDLSFKVINENSENKEAVLNVDEFKTVHTLPLVSNGKLIAGICFYKKTQYDYTEFKFYDTMIKELVLLFKMRYLYSETEHLSVTDGLTGLYNRRHFESNIEREFLRVKRYPADLSLAMIDIDNFKQINDNYGHQFGDYVLKELSGLIVASFRKTDMIYRYGGEELSVILTETPPDNAVIPLERLRERISQYPFEFNGQQIAVTVSIGVGYNYPEAMHQDMIVESADKALYKAKANGKNKVVKYFNEQFDNVVQ